MTHKTMLLRHLSSLIDSKLKFSKKEDNSISGKQNNFKMLSRTKVSSPNVNAMLLCNVICTKILLATFVQAQLKTPSADISDFNDVILIKNDRHYYQTSNEQNNDQRSLLNRNHDWLCKELLQKREINGCRSKPPFSVHESAEICASDGRLYASACDLELQSCLRNVTLTQLSPEECKNIINNQVSAPRNQHQRGHLIRLKTQCDLSVFERFKQLLLADSRGPSDLFARLDANHNNLVEAHELWPKIITINEEAKAEATRSDSEYLASNQEDNEDQDDEQEIIKQTMNNIFPANQKLATIRSTSYQSSSSAGLINGRFSYAQVWPGVCPRNWVHCWRLLDFAFEPYFGTSTNPCSLSHLLLYGASPHDSGLTRQSFEQLFATYEKPMKQANKALEGQPRVELVALPLGGSLELNCSSSGAPSACWWTRHGERELASSLRGDLHASIIKSTTSKNSQSHQVLLIRDAQVYLSGPFKCHCKSLESWWSSSSSPLHSGETSQEKLYMLQVIAEPRVELEPASQFSMEKSGATFECVYDLIDTRAAPASTESDNDNDNDNKDVTRQLEASGQFGTRLRWDAGRDLAPGDATRYKLSMQASKLRVEPINRADSGRHSCQVNVPIRHGNGSLQAAGKASARLFVVVDNEESHRSPAAAASTSQDCDAQESDTSDEKEPLNLWIFQDSGVSVYKLRQDDGADGELELERQLDGHSPISSKVDGNWNQLTLCGGLSPEQAVICEWSDNAIAVNVPAQGPSDASGNVDFRNGSSDEESNVRSRNLQNLQNNNNSKCKTNKPKAKLSNDKTTTTTTNSRQFIYVGQPNLNRIIVMDARKFEIVSIIQTEPQPRRLHLVRPAKRRLSKWIKRRLAPKQQNYESAESSPSDQEGKKVAQQRRSRRKRQHQHLKQQRQQQQHHEHHLDSIGANLLNGADATSLNGQEGTSDAIAAQFDIWLLCYGQPLIADPSLGSLDALGLEAPPTFANRAHQSMQMGGGSGNVTSGRVARRPSIGARPLARRPLNPFARADINTWPFAWPPFLTMGMPDSNSLGPNGGASGLVGDKESRLRNRKSVHIVQSTFFKLPTNMQKQEKRDSIETPEWAINEIDPESPNYHDRNKLENNDPISEFRYSTLISTHHLTLARNLIIRDQEYDEQQFVASPVVQDLIEDLALPETVRALEFEAKHKARFAYISHYNERRLFRVSLDNYRYEREIELANQCDPIQLTPSALGLLVIQCRSPISHKPTGQLLLDELSSEPVEFNEKIKAQDLYLSPDHKYLISVYTNQQHLQTNSKRKRATVINEANNSNETNSIIFVQTLTTSGAQFQYEIKTSTLEISECSFVWRDGYYVAIFVSTNKQDQESEILSLRLADGRLELMARVPGLLDTHRRNRHRSQLTIAPKVHLAALSTNQGIFIVDLQENRISQSIQQHQSPPTLLWV